ncbi:hypothetical protein Taro_013045 [Colocasia esculenta]|uniref:Uncharacterized protein n=1 Tax=Colocasia esculenta TaxID=4460 RepID=A0A843UAI4_COLES|nr:hypothetical protein [Colocasia esculenta]
MGHGVVIGAMCEHFQHSSETISYYVNHVIKVIALLRFTYIVLPSGTDLVHPCIRHDDCFYSYFKGVLPAERCLDAVCFLAIPVLVSVSRELSIAAIVVFLLSFALHNAITPSGHLGEAPPFLPSGPLVIHLLYRAESPLPAGRWKEEERTYAHTSRAFYGGVTSATRVGGEASPAHCCCRVAAVATTPPAASRGKGAALSSLSLPPLFSSPYKYPLGGEGEECEMCKCRAQCVQCAVCAMCMCEKERSGDEEMLFTHNCKACRVPSHWLHIYPNYGGDFLLGPEPSGPTLGEREEDRR